MPLDTATTQSCLRTLPKVHTLLESGAALKLLADWPRASVLAEMRAEIDDLRQQILAGETPAVTENAVLEAVGERLKAKDLKRLRRVVNATGIVIHTNLGRAPMAEEAVRAVTEAARGYTNLEMDLHTGKRGGRGEQIEELLQTLTGAEAALVVNNNAAAVLLALGTLASGGEVVISRGELVEIGGGFRVPDVITQSGARLVEVGTTNKTRLSDYARAAGADTKVLLKVHPSNYKLVGFVEETLVSALAGLADERGLILMNDLGSGALVDLTQYGLPPEPTVPETLAAGAGVVTISGDKLLGGPQCGLILGRQELIGRLRANPLYRALRADKLTLAALEATLRLYLDPARLTETVPVLGMLAAGKDVLARRAKRLRTLLAKVDGLETRLADGEGFTGGGALPTVPLPTKRVLVRAAGRSAEALAAALRRADPPVIAVIDDEWLVFDVRTVRDDEFRQIRDALRGAAESL